MLPKGLTISNNQIITNLFWVSSFTIITAISAQIEIPMYPVPFTLQTFFVLLTGAFLGYKLGFFSMGFYLMLGLIGLPVFAGGTFGLWKILGPTGGYLLSFPIAAFLVGYLVNRYTGYWWLLLSMALGSILIYIFGTAHLYLVYFQDWKKAIQAGFLIFTLWDILKIFAATTIIYKYKQSFSKK